MMSCSLKVSTLMLDLSYEALPPNFSVAENMAAGAFAGIAVSLPLRDRYAKTCSS